ncbi:MAG: outer membrane protein, partial [Planctomycetia bacterium]
MKWRYGTVAGVASLLCLLWPWRPAVADVAPALDLHAFAPWDEEAVSLAGYDAVVPADEREPLSLLPPTTAVAHDMLSPSARRFYLTGIIGGSFLVVSADNTPSSSLTEGGALGMALERSNGRLRVEVEGRYRGPIGQTYLGFNENFSVRDRTLVCLSEARSYGWSSLANVWRDFELTEHIDLYGGGGIGAAGFQTEYQKINVSPPAPRIDRSITGYAWQVGAGAIWNVSDRVAVDASYRIFGFGWTVTREDVAFGFLRSEILLSLRVYEPFRGLLR